MKNKLTSFELKIPPLIWLAFFSTVMWMSAKLCPVLIFDFPFRRELTLLIVAAAVFFMLAGVQAFKKAQTTVNPLQPGNSSQLVILGIYRYTRNPMYVGMTLLLSAWFFILGCIVNCVFVLGFVVCINNLQILPEERILKVKFGEEYNDENEEILIIPHAEYELNVSQYIYELIVLAVPQKRVHPGVLDGTLDSEILDKLEELSPKHSEDKDNNEEIDPRWNTLKKLLTDK